MVLTLPETRTELWMGFTSKLRAQIKRSKRENPKIRFGGKEYLDDFYSVYARNMRDLGSPPHSKEFIRNILDSFTDNSCIIMLYMNNRPVAAGLLIGDGETLNIPLASTIRDVNPLSINMLMYSEVLKFAIRKGYRHFDFGRSTTDSGTFRFKQQWGAQAKQLYWHYGLVKRGEVPLLSPANPKYALMINIWKRLPVKLTQWVGPRIVKNIP
jgi:serine/alanine adding enzyme